ncbi:hypothetical protein ACTMNS_12725, partial [Staphylococcus haemolyticus]
FVCYFVQLFEFWVFNPKPNNLDRRFRIYRETLSRFSCAASTAVKPSRVSSPDNLSLSSLIILLCVP